MRVLGSIPHPKFKISVFTLERFFYVEIEAGPMKQGFKLHKERFDGLSDIGKFLDEEFLQESHNIFEKMYGNYKAAQERHPSTS